MPPEGRVVAVDGAAVRRRVHRRILPPLFLLSLFCQLDRSNLSFAALQMAKDLPFFSQTIQGLGSGLFFVGYLLQVPASTACVALGHRRFLPAILVAWGAVAMLFATVRSTASFLALRLLLGVAEAGAYPGVMYCLSLFYAPQNLGLAYTAVATATAVAGLAGAPVAAAIISLDGVGGLRGWQWLFLLEGIPPLLLAAALPLLLPSAPHTACFLAPEEQDWLWQEVCGQHEGLELVQQASKVPAPQPAGAVDSTTQGSGAVVHEATPWAAAVEMPPTGPVELSPGESAALLAPKQAAQAGTPGSCSGGSGGSGAGACLFAAVMRGLLDRRICHLAAVMLLVDVTMNACNFFLPSLVLAALQGQLQSDSGNSSAASLASGSAPAPAPAPATNGSASSSSGSGATGVPILIRASLLSALPFCGAAVAMVGNAWHSRRANERHLHTSVPMLAAALAWAALPAVAGLGHAPALLALTVAASGIWATHGPLFSWPAALLDRQAAAIGFALVKTGGAVGAFAGPAIIGWMADALHGFTGAMLLLGGVAAASALLVYVFDETKQ